MGTALDTAIGLTFIFLLFSTIVSAIQELFSWMVELRAHTMRKELTNLLADPSADLLLKEFLAHPHVRQQSGRLWRTSSEVAPSYLPAGTFSATLVDMLTGSSAREALPAMRKVFKDHPPTPGTLGDALNGVFALDATAGEDIAVTAFEQAIRPRSGETAEQFTTRFSGEKTALDDLIKNVPQSILKVLTRAALQPAPKEGTTVDPRVAAVRRLAELIARRSPAVALQFGLDALPATPVRNALLGVLDAASEESRTAAVATVSAVVRGATDQIKALEEMQKSLPEGPLKVAVGKLLQATDDSMRSAAAVDLTRLMVLDPAGELRHVATLLGAESQLGRVLRLALDRGAKTGEEVRARVEGLFDGAMEHCSALFRRQVQVAVIFISLGVAVVANVDTLVIARELSTNGPMREAVAASAARWVQEHPATAPPRAGDTPSAGGSPRSVNDITRDLLAAHEGVREIALPIGWSHDELARLIRPPQGSEAAKDLWYARFLKLIGLLISALGLSLGAPFWFGLVSRLVNIRAVGRPSTADTPAATNG